MYIHPWDCQAYHGFYGCKDMVTWNDWRGKNHLKKHLVFHPCRQFLLPLDSHLTLFYLRLQINTNSSVWECQFQKPPAGLFPSWCSSPWSCEKICAPNWIRKLLCPISEGLEISFGVCTCQLSVLLVMLLTSLGNVTWHFYGIGVFICLRGIGNSRHSFMENQTVVKMKNSATSAKLLNHSNDKF